MSTKRNSIVWLMILLVAAGCGRPGTAGLTSTAPPTRPGATPTANGTAVSFSGIRFIIPAGLASGGGAARVADMANEPVPEWEKTPAFIQFTLENYAVHGTLFPARISVFQAAVYQTSSTGAAESLKRLRALIGGRGHAFDNQAAPFVPFFNAGQAFVAQTARLKFRNGSGVRMLTQYDQAPVPVNNHELVYHFEGLTGDGQSYIIAVLPVQTAALAADGKPDTAVPAGGVPFTQADPAGYFNAVSRSLNDTAPDQFTPSLAALDALVQSIQVVGP